METEQRISEAKRIIRKVASRHGKRGSRIHQYANEDNNDRRRALDGLCGHCIYLRLKFENRFGKDLVSLGCDMDHEPLILYQDTPLGDKADCSDFTQREIPTDSVK